MPDKSAVLRRAEARQSRADAGGNGDFRKNILFGDERVESDQIKGIELPVLVFVVADIRPECAPRPFAFAVTVAPDGVKSDARPARSPDDRRRLLRAFDRLRFFVEIGFLNLETRILDFREMSEKFSPTFQKFLTDDRCRLFFGGFRRGGLPVVTADPFNLRFCSSRS